MKKLFLLIALTMVYNSLLLAQVAINDDGAAPDASAALDVFNTNKGVLIPRMSCAQRNAILNPAEGLMVYCTDCSGSGAGALSIYQNGKWINYSWDCTKPVTPVAGVHTRESNQIIWRWASVNGVTGYKWNTQNDYPSAINTGDSTSKTETGLAYDSVYTRYVWAYNDCGFSSPVVLTQKTEISCAILSWSTMLQVP